MKKLFILTLLAVPFFASCSDDDNCPTTDSNEVNSSDLVTPDLDIRLASTQALMTGALEAYPCKDGSSIYFGNYVQNKLTPFPGYYKLQDGEIYGKINRLVTLPIGIYNMIYWGTAKPDRPIYNDPAVMPPPIIVGGDLSQQYFSLYKTSGDTLYNPTFDLVYAVKSIDIGVEELSASMKRVVSGVQVTVKNKDNSKLSSTISNMQIKIGSIAQKLNIYTAEPENQSCTVEFPLTLSADSTQMSNASVMLFPSGPAHCSHLLLTSETGMSRLSGKH